MCHRITVIGSSNVDFIMKVTRLPQLGETVTDGEFLQTFGGKGANQAVAAARAGGNASFVSCLGDDMYAPRIIENLNGDGIDTGQVVREAGSSTGTALIMFDDQGENYLTVAPGANYRLTPEHVRNCEDLVENSSVILLQMEIEVDTTREVLRLAGAHGTQIILNYAPVQEEMLELGPAVTSLVVNETEAAALVGRALEGQEALEGAAGELLERGPQHVFLTLGADGVLVASGDGIVLVPAFPVTPVDTTAAGDTFCGTLAVALVEQKPIPDAVRFANAASALAVTKVGAQPSIPERNEIDALLAAGGSAEVTIQG